MFIPRLYLDMHLAPNIELSLDKDKSHYLLTVLRMRDQDELIVFNGKGGEYTAKLQALKKQAIIKLNHFMNVNRESKLELHIGQALLRGDKMDLVIQKATELGVTSITPLLTQNAKIKLDKERELKRHIHWQEIAISAAEQSGRTVVPFIHSVSSMPDWVQKHFQGVSIVFDIEAKQTLKNLKPVTSLRLATGPESGWTDVELKTLIAQGFDTYLLGPRILRAETASLVAISALQALMGDF